MSNVYFTSKDWSLFFTSCTYGKLNYLSSTKIILKSVFKFSYFLSINNLICLICWKGFYVLHDKSDIIIYRISIFKYNYMIIQLLIIYWNFLYLCVEIGPQKIRVYVSDKLHSALWRWRPFTELHRTYWKFLNSVSSWVDYCNLGPHLVYDCCNLYFWCSLVRLFCLGRATTMGRRLVFRKFLWRRILKILVYISKKNVRQHVRNVFLKPTMLKWIRDTRFWDFKNEEQICV